jgi:uncharacterized protein
MISSYMKILAFTDVHGDISAISRVISSVKKEKIDVLICAGDISNFSDNLKELVQMFKRIEIPFIMLPGNHEDPKELGDLCKNLKNCIMLHKKIHKIQDVLFVGSGGGGFSSKDIEFENFVNKNKDGILNAKKIVLITHAPPINTKLDLIPHLGHCGCKSYRKFIEKYQPSLAISGHLHETFRKMDHLGHTFMFNPGENGKILEI